MPQSSSQSSTAWISDGYRPLAHGDAGNYADMRARHDISDSCNCCTTTRRHDLGMRLIFSNKLTRRTQASTSARLHGGVLPKWLHGSSVTYAVAPAAAWPVCTQHHELQPTVRSHSHGRPTWSACKVDTLFESILRSVAFAPAPCYERRRKVSRLTMVLCTCGKQSQAGCCDSSGSRLFMI